MRKRFSVFIMAILIFHMLTPSMFVPTRAIEGTELEADVVEIDEVETDVLEDIELLSKDETIVDVAEGEKSTTNDKSEANVDQDIVVEEEANTEDEVVEELFEEGSVQQQNIGTLAETSKDLGSDIFTDVKINIDGELLGEGVTEVEITDDLNLKFTFNWELSDDVELNEGDWAQIKIPNALKGIDGRMDGDLFDGDGTTVGTYEITEDGYLRVEFNNELTDRSERSGEVGFLLEFDVTEFEEDANQSIKFEDRINKEFIIKAKPSGEVHDIKKFGVANENINPEYLNWTIDVNTKLENLTNATVEDIIPEGLELDFDSIEVYELTVGYQGKVTEGNIVNGLGISEIDSGFKVDLGATDKAYRIKYKTNISEFKSEFTNDAVLKDEGEEKDKDKYTITGLERGSLIEKKGKLQGDQIIWTIDVNKSESSLKNVLVKDDIPEGLDIESIKVWKLNKSGNDWSKDEELQGDFTTFPVDLGDIDGAYRFEVTTEIDYRHFKEYTKELVFDNEAVLEVNGEDEDQDDAKVTVKRESLLEKNGWESTKYGDSKISWEISVNKAQHTIKNAVIQDTLGQGLVLIEDTVKVYDDKGEEVDSSKYTFTETPDGFTIELGEINSEYKIKYDTKITENLPEGQEGYKNTVGLEGDGLDGVGVEDTTKEPTIPSNVSNKYEKSRENNKEIDGITYDGLNYTEKTMSWKLTVDAIKEEITELTITDSFEPEKSMKFIAESLRVVIGERVLELDTDYTLEDNGVEGFELVFIGEHKPLERAKYEVYFKTSFDPNDVLGADGVLNPGNEYKNTVTYTGKTKDVEGNENDFTKEAYAQYTVKEEYVDGGKKSGNLDRENRTINWEIFANASSRDLTGGPFVITDKLTQGEQSLNEDVKVYEFSLDKEGNFIKGDEITDGFTVVYNEEKDGFTLTFADGVDKPVLVEFSSKINGLSEEWYKNEAKVTDKNNQEKTHDAQVKYDRHNQFINKEATNVDGNITYTDDEIDWKISINESLSDIKNAVFKDTISEGLILVNDSIKVYKDAIAEENLVELTKEAITITPIGEAGTELSINLGDIEESRYFVTYQTVVVAIDGNISNEASLLGDDEQLGSSSKKEYTARQSSWGAGSGKGNRGQIEIIKVDADTEETITSPAKFELYYLLNGEKQIVTGEAQVTEDGKIQYGNLPFRTYYLKEVEAPEGYVLPNEEIVIEVNKENKEIELTVENNAELEIAVTKVWNDADNQDGVRPGSITVNLLANGEEVESTTLDEDNRWSAKFTGLSPVDENGEEIEYTIEEVEVTGYEVDISGTVTDGFEITNTHNPAVIDIEGKKTWDDANNQDGKRPESITVRLLANGEEIDDVEVTVEDEWSYSFTDLPKFENGEEIIYTVQEDKVEDYSTEIKGFDITNSYTPEQTSINVVKIWEDADNQDGIRPDSITVTLVADGNETDKIIELTEENNWQASFTDLDVYADGKEIEYTVKEVPVEGYEAAITGSSDHGYVITNTHEPAVIDINGTKTWEDAENQDGKRPESITVRLLANGEEIDDLEVTEEDEWSYSFTDLPKFENGEEITYTVQEDKVDDYSTEIDGFNITNSYTPEQTSINVVKIWEDADNQDGIRADSITIKLLANGKETGKEVELHAGNNWQADFTALDVYANGEEIVYTVEEVAVDGYETSISELHENNFIITNTHDPALTNIKGTKTWDDANDQDGKRPESITIHLLANGTQVDSLEVTPDEDGNWSYTFENLPVYESGEEITYTVTENSVEGYTTTIEGYDVLNTRTPDETSVTVTKAWEDSYNQDGIRPESIEVQLTANGQDVGDVQVLSEENHWTYTWTALPVNQQGEAIDYSVIEVTELEAYEVAINDENHGNIIITNSYTPETTEVTGVKVWEDNNNQHGKRAESITVNLLANNVIVESTEVTEETDWAFAFTDLPKYENGEEIVYSVEEVEVNGYHTTITGDAQDGFTITNTKKTYAIGDYTWIDTNKDGIQDEDEPVLPGVIVELYDENGNKIAETTTDENGLYIFDELDAGKYKVKFTLTEEQAKKYKFTKQNADETSTKDSDADPETGWTVEITLDDSNEYLTTHYDIQGVKATEGIDPTWDAGVIEIEKDAPEEPEEPGAPEDPENPEKPGEPESPEKPELPKTATNIFNIAIAGLALFIAGLFIRFMRRERA